MNNTEKLDSIITKDFLQREYIEHKRSALNIANELGISQTPIFRYLKKYNIPIRNRSRVNISKSELFNLYIIEDKLPSEIAKILHCSEATVFNLVDRFKIQRKRLIKPTRRNNLSGRKFGLLTAIKDIGFNDHGSRIWKCKCDCGKIIDRDANALLNSKSVNQSCGHINNTIMGFGCIGGAEWNSILSSIRDRGITMSLHIEDAYFLFEAQNQLCNLTGEPIYFGKNRTASLDRIDSKDIYNIMNCQWVHKEINYIKGKLPLDKLLFYCKNITDWQYLTNFGYRKYNKDYSVDLDYPIKRHPHWKGYGQISGSVWSEIIKNQRRFEISIIDCWNLFIHQKGKCAISGLNLYFPQKRNDLRLRTASLDRIDSSKDYVIDNIQWVHQDINFMKQELLQDKFINWCYKIAIYEK